MAATRYIERPSITAPSLRVALRLALRLYPNPNAHILIDRTPDPRVFRVRTK